MTVLQVLDQPVDGWVVSEVTRAWQGKTVVCMATGPSLTADQIEHVRGAREADACRVIVVNDNYAVAPWADLLFFADRKWFDWHKDKPAFQKFTGLRATLKFDKEMREVPGLHFLRYDGPEGLSEKPGFLRTGSNAGHMALNIAFLAGAARILLLGYDGQSWKGRMHHFGNHPDGTGPLFEKQRSALRTVDKDAKKHGVRIVNCSPGSALDQFERGSIEAVLPATHHPSPVTAA